jgi:Flp pilus assembly protein TadD
MIRKLFSKKTAVIVEKTLQNAMPIFLPEEVFQHAIMHHQQGNFSQAECLYRQILQHDPQHVNTLHFLGVMAYQVGQSESAVQLIRQALHFSSPSCALYSNLGLALQALGQTEAAVESYQKAIELQFEHIDAHYNLGNALRDLGRFEEAVISHQNTLRLNPQHVDAQLNLAFSLLSLGQFAEGWAYYEARYCATLPWQAGKPPVLFPQMPFPQWCGESLVGKTLLICLEQGFGDEIQFVRYMSVLKTQGVKFLSLVCKKPLQSLFERVTAVDKIFIANEVFSLPLHDYWTPVLSIPFHCQTTAENIPTQIPYLAASPEKVATIAAELKGMRDFKVGVCWKGDVNFKGDALRSPGIDRFNTLFKLVNVKFFTLQPDTREEFLTHVGKNGIDRGHEINAENFEEAAALIMNMDLVISSCTAICHLAGALGKPVWVVLPFVADWRWMTKCENTPWYPNTRLFRQSHVGDWEGVFERVEKQLQKEIAVLRET